MEGWNIGIMGKEKNRTKMEKELESGAEPVMSVYQYFKGVFQGFVTPSFHHSIIPSFQLLALSEG